MLVGAQEQEVLRLQIPVHHSHGVAIVDYPDYLTTEIGRSPLGIMSLGDYPVEELAAGAELHNQIDRVTILVGALELHDVAVTGHVVHDLDFPADVLDVVAVDELPRRDRLAGELLLRLLVGHQVGYAKLAAAELAAEDVGRTDILHGPSQNAAHGSGGCWGCGGGGEMCWSGRGWGRTGIGREDVDGVVGGAVVVGRDSAGVTGILLAAAVAHFDFLGGLFGQRESMEKWEVGRCFDL